MTRILLAIMACLALWAGLASWGAWSLRAANARQGAVIAAQADALERAESARKRAEAALVLQRQKNAATAREAASTRRSLDEALAAQPDWASQPVPEEVQRVLESHP